MPLTGLCKGTAIHRKFDSCQDQPFSYANASRRYSYVITDHNLLTTLYDDIFLNSNSFLRDETNCFRFNL